ncbi:MAG: hypothetical protein GVY07_04315 [Bacteroidetes bacterium]|jgi:hypothetical protein|nr:hypothetical protein [Bacteroidota bacterium]
MSDRIYSEEEVARLIRRAVELESERTTSGGGGSEQGLTMNDLEKIAADSGIDPELMRKAAEELEDTNRIEDVEETTKVNKSEIVAEHWIKADVNSRILDDLILELNHRFGTSQYDINWWDQLWNDYSGKAKVDKTATSVDWRYTDEVEFYTTRVLLQQRGDKLRIRVSKRMPWNLSWDSDALNTTFGVIGAIIITTLSAVLGLSLLDSPVIGFLGGLVLSALFVPLYLKFNRYWLKKNKDGITEIAEALVLQAKRISSELEDQDQQQSNRSGKSRSTNFETIEVDSEINRNRDTEGTRLKNHLRE